ncbi:hypothetical protein ABZ682_22820 [Streptomyces griseoviridis]|uniref:hypothetical protein n=1 Tax=Streptomyces griseoviridis TaxID=45398 RepID=UPI0033C16D02
MTMLDIALTMLLVLAVLLLIASVGLRGLWRFVWRMAVMGVAVICVELTVIYLLPGARDWIMEVTK